MCVALQYMCVLRCLQQLAGTTVIRPLGALLVCACIAQVQTLSYDSELGADWLLSDVEVMPWL